MNRLFRHAAVLATLFLLTTVAPRLRSGSAGAAPPAAAVERLPRPVQAIERVMVVSVDGMRPDVMLRAKKTPTFRRLMESGSYSFWAKTIPESVTLPSHTSMLTGVSAERHGIHWNGDVKESELYYPKVPTLFDLAKRVGLTTAMVTGKSKFVALARPGSLDWSSIQGTNDQKVADEAVRIVRDYQPEVLFVHFPSTDGAGHSKGWGSKEHVAAIEGADEALGRVLAVMDELKLTEKTLIIVSADHGGAGKSHGPGDDRSRHIPWIASGPGLYKDYDLTQDASLNVKTEDTFATACWVLGIKPEGEIEGQPVTQIVEGLELLQKAE